jgi:sucrose phosphorylase
MEFWKNKEKIFQKIKILYPKEAKQILLEIERILHRQRILKKYFKKKSIFDEKDIFLITYPDSFFIKNKKPLNALYYFLDKYFKDEFSAIHILPFYPFSSDRGFSVVNFYQVKKEFGSWSHIEKIANRYRLMSDLVLNHVSTKSKWFKGFLSGKKKYKNYFISFLEEETKNDDFKKVFRPRATSLLTPFKTKDGLRYVWTTFSVGDYTDQVDLNYKNPEVFLEMIKILLFLFEKGVRIIRLDAIAYIWKELGTSCLHLPQVHVIVQIMRLIIESIYPDGVIITETNVPHKENISYFGDGKNEAHMVYNFALPPLVLHAFITNNSSFLTYWALSTDWPKGDNFFYNFLDSHDGIGVLGAKEILSENEFKKIFIKIEKGGGRLSTRSLPNGGRAVYEINTTWWSALVEKDLSFELNLKKFITSRAISFALKGVPAVYYLSLFGRENDLKTYKKTKINRDLNRENLSVREIENWINNKKTKEAVVFKALIDLIRKRKSYIAFHPQAEQKILPLSGKVFSILRWKDGQKILALHNVTKDYVRIKYQNKKYQLGPYDFLWQPI